MEKILFETDGPVARIGLNDPARRNAMGLALFDELDDAVALVRDRDDIRSVVLFGEGRVFCAGFDLAAAVEDSTLMPRFIRRLSLLLRSIRRLPQPVVASVHGAAIAGGCAILSACDFVVVERTAKLGYPVHRIGVSPAVTLPTLMQAVGPGAARALVMSGEVISGEDALRIGLATSVVEEGAAFDRAMEVAEAIARKPPHAVRVTKAWLNELDGSLDDARFDPPAERSAEASQGGECVDLLRKAWSTPK